MFDVYSDNSCIGWETGDRVGQWHHTKKEGHSFPGNRSMKGKKNDEAKRLFPFSYWSRKMV